MEEALWRCNDSHLANANMTWLSLSFREVAAPYKSNVCIHVALSELGFIYFLLLFLPRDKPGLNECSLGEKNVFLGASGE